MKFLLKSRHRPPISARCRLSLSTGASLNENKWAKTPISRMKWREHATQGDAELVQEHQRCRWSRCKREQLCGRKREVDLGNHRVPPKNYDTIRPDLSFLIHKRCRSVVVLCAGGRLWSRTSFSCKIISNCSAFGQKLELLPRFDLNYMDNFSTNGQRIIRLITVF